jgi:hypothetical protein
LLVRGASATRVGCALRRSKLRPRESGKRGAVFGLRQTDRGVPLRWKSRQNGCRRFVGYVPQGKSLRMLAQPVSDPPVLGRERDEAGEERSLRSWAVFTGILPSGGVFTAGGGWVPSGAPSPSAGMRLAWWSCARRRASLEECVYDRAGSVPPREGRQVGEDGAQRCVEDRVQRKALFGATTSNSRAEVGLRVGQGGERNRLRADASSTDRLSGPRAARWFRNPKRRVVERLGWRHRSSDRCLLLSSTMVRPDPGFAPELRLWDPTWE